jgi:hypothetical protein
MEHRYSVLFNYVRYTYEDVNRYLGIKKYGFVPMRLPLPPS